jgi:hypothetical protein
LEILLPHCRRSRQYNKIIVSPIQSSYFRSLHTVTVTLINICRSISLAHCQISSRTVHEISKSCAKLRSIDVSYCEKLTKGTVFQLRQHCPLLHNMNISGIQVTDQILEAFLHPVPNCQVSYLYLCTTVYFDRY